MALRHLALLGLVYIVAGKAPIMRAAPGHGRKDEKDCFIVKLNANATEKRDSLFGKARGKGGKAFDKAMNGFFKCGMDAAQLDELADDPDVELIEEDQEMKATASTWNLDRIDQRTLPLSLTTFLPGANGLGVTIYVMDTGIQYNHIEFGGRASLFYDNVGDGKAGADCNGHGTHVASVAGGATYGVAKKATLKSVRVLDCSKTGTSSRTIDALNKIQTSGAGKGVINLSLSGAKSASVNYAVSTTTTKGYLVVAAAGNNALDACNYSPGSAPSALTVGATDKYDARWTSSNTGTCMDVFAPGAMILGAKWSTTSTSSTVYYEGTSMASPHVAGVAAAYLGALKPATVTDLANLVMSKVTANVLKNLGTGSPNKLVFMDPTVKPLTTAGVDESPLPDDGSTPEEDICPAVHDAFPNAEFARDQPGCPLEDVLALLQGYGCDVVDDGCKVIKCQQPLPPSVHTALQTC